MLEKYEDKKIPNVKYKKIQIEIPEETIMLNTGIVYNNNGKLNFTNVGYDTEDIKKLLENEE